MIRVKCYACRADMWITENTIKGIIYSLCCDKCGRDHVFWVPAGRHFSIIGSERLGEKPRPVKIEPGTPSGRLKQTLCINPKECPLTQDQMKDVAFEMFADGEIDEDLLNKMLMKIMKM